MFCSCFLMTLTNSPLVPNVQSCKSATNLLDRGLVGPSGPMIISVTTIFAESVLAVMLLKASVLTMMTLNRRWRTTGAAQNSSAIRLPTK